MHFIAQLRLDESLRFLSAVESKFLRCELDAGRDSGNWRSLNVLIASSPHLSMISEATGRTRSRLYVHVHCILTPLDHRASNVMFVLFTMVFLFDKILLLRDHYLLLLRLLGKFSHPGILAHMFTCSTFHTCLSIRAAAGTEGVWGIFGTSTRQP